MARNTKVVTKISAALAAPEDGVAEPTRRRSGSFTAAIIDLEVGETASRATRLPVHYTLEQVVEDMATHKESFRNAITASVRNARNKTGATYMIEVVDTLTAQRGLYLIALVTRTA